MSTEAKPDAAPDPHDFRRGRLIYLGMGSNRGDRLANLRRAMEELGKVGVNVQRASSFYKTEPVDFGPQAWFLNCAVEATTTLMPMQLLRAVKSVEWTLGRRTGVSKGPRPIDIDILLYENVVVRTAALTIPHERMNTRRFVLIPLRELAPALRHPLSRRTVAEMLQDTPDRSQVIRYKPETRDSGNGTRV
jgi:2-amino-4-hydroxy-6-hydroxymethyldihydropteridine diphosphokinase